jgi:hypothetical protein
VIETEGANIRFDYGLLNRGAIRKASAGSVGSFFQVFGLTTLEQGSLLQGSSADFRGSSTIRGAVAMTSEISVGEDAQWSTVIEDASGLDTPQLRIGIGPTELRVPQDASIGAIVSTYNGLSAIAPIRILSTGASRLTVSGLSLRSRSLSGGTSGGRLVADRVTLDGLAVPALHNIELEIAGPATSSVSGAIVSADSGTRIIQRGQIRFSSGGFGRPPLSPPGAFYFEHRGELVPASGQSTIEACIISSGGTILPSGNATLTLFPLPAGECP